MSEIELPRIRRRALGDAQRASQLLVGVRSRLAANEDEVHARLRALQPLEALDFWGHQGIPVRAITRARELGVDDDLWTAHEREVRSAAREAATVQELISVQVTRALGQAGIRAVSLKGPAMAARLYGDPTLRYPSADLDLLVPTARLYDASAIVERLGWAGASELQTGPFGELPEFHFMHPGQGATPSIELHWRVQWYEPGSHAQAVLDRAEEAFGLLVPSPVDQLSILLLAFARDGFHRLRLAADIAAWWDHFGAEHGAAAAQEFADGPLARPLAFAAHAAAAVVGSPPLGERRSSPAARLATGVALADRPSPERRVYSQVAVVDLLAAPAGERRQRWASTWLRRPEAVVARHPRFASSPLIPGLRIATMLRTVTHLPSILGRAVLGRPRALSR